MTNTKMTINKMNIITTQKKKLTRNKNYLTDNEKYNNLHKKQIEKYKTKKTNTNRFNKINQ